jgi:hypothetical protein
VHPLDGGLFRRKYRRDRRPGVPLEMPVVFHARFACESLLKHVRLVRMLWQHWRVVRRVERDADAYTDIAMTPVQASEFEEMQMYTATPATKIAVAKLRRHKGATSARVS